MKCLRKELSIIACALKGTMQEQISKFNEVEPMKSFYKAQHEELTSRKQDIYKQMNQSCSLPGHDINCCGLLCPCGCEDKYKRK